MLASGEFNVEQGGPIVAIAEALLPLLIGYAVAFNVIPLLRYIKKKGTNAAASIQSYTTAKYAYIL
jgi:hypothetical protein